jgi:hypothetical protein
MDGGNFPPMSLRLGGLLTSFILAGLTYFLIEKKINVLTNAVRKRLSLILISLLTVLIIISFSSYQYIHIKLKSSISPTVDSYKCANNSSDVCELGNRKSDLRIILYGDSHIKHLVNQIVIQLGENYAIDLITTSSCLMGTKVRGVDEPYESECNKKIRALESLLGSSPFALITGQRWHGYGINNKEEIEGVINDRFSSFQINPKILIILGSTADISYDCELANIRPFRFGKKDCAQSSETKKVNQLFIETTQKMKKPSNVFFVYPYIHLCPNDFCLANNDGKMNYIDANHLSNTGSKEIVQEISVILNSNIPIKK